jgi:hypothetical protein
MHLFHVCDFCRPKVNVIFTISISFYDHTAKIKALCRMFFLLQALLGTDRDGSRWMTCVNYVNENFGMAVGRMFVKQTFDERAKANVSRRFKSFPRLFFLKYLSRPGAGHDRQHPRSVR